MRRLHRLVRQAGRQAGSAQELTVTLESLLRRAQGSPRSTDRRRRNMSADLRKRLLAILAADVAGYSRLMAIDDQATVSMLDAARSVFRDQIGAHGGRVVDMAGDSVLAVFESAMGAMSAALAVQRTLGGSSADASE